MGSSSLSGILASSKLSKDCSRTTVGAKTVPKEVVLFGHFGHDNFGNEATLQAFLYHLRRYLPEVRVRCICTGPAKAAAIHEIDATSATPTVVDSWRPRNRFLGLLRSLLVGVPNEVYRWMDGFRKLRGTKAFIIPGTGLLNDAYGLGGWGPYVLFKWSLIAKLSRCKLLFVAVGAGPLYTRRGKWLVRAALGLAEFRSYRDPETKTYLRSIGAASPSDPVCPDLAFSLVTEGVHFENQDLPRPVVGLGLMLYHGKLSADSQRELTYSAYLNQLLIFAKWLLARGYGIRLLVGEYSDERVVSDFEKLLMAQVEKEHQDRIIHEPINSVRDLIDQLAQTDIVVATRFHNILLALYLERPVLSISFHQKCTSLMEQMGLRNYYQDIKRLSGERLIGQFCQLEEEQGSLKRLIHQKVTEFSGVLDEQYRVLFEEILAG